LIILKSAIIIQDMKISVNGELLETTPDVGTVGELLSSLGLSDQRVAVEHNRVILPKNAYAETAISEGDALEILSFVGGG
jgi:thiamine biosynthesis protein ThiS